jgi:stress response protein YsnF
LLWITNINEVIVMPTSIIGLFEDQDTGRRVVSALVEIGCKEDAIETLSKTSVDEITNRLVEAGYEQDKARRYGEALQKGGVLIVTEVEDEKSQDALSAMRRFDVLTPEALLERTGSEKSERSEEGATAQVIEEELEVGKNRASSGKRLKTEVTEREVQESVTLHEDKVEVERNRADRTLKPEEADKAFKETSVVVSGYTEKPVVSKQAHVVEEVGLNKQSNEREVTVSGTVRRQDVKVEDVETKSSSSKKS